MTLNLVSPGVKIREVDLTIGRVEATTDQVGAIVGPFERGPVDAPTLITNEQDLLNVFGKPISGDGQYEYWLSASNYLSYGGVLRVVRSNGTNLNNSNSAVSFASTIVKITNYEDYQNSHLSDTQWRWSSRNPGSWANNLKVCMIDSLADQTISGIVTSATPVVTFDTIVESSGSVLAQTTSITGINTTGIQTSQAVATDYFDFIPSSTTVVGVASTAGGLGTVTLSEATTNLAPIGSIVFRFGTRTTTLVGPAVQVGFAVTQAINNIQYAKEDGTIETFNGYLRGLITGIGNSSINVKITDRVAIGTIGTPPVSTSVDYAKNSTINSFASPSVSPIRVNIQSGNQLVAYSSGITSDWYDNQTLGLSNSTIYWNSITEKPGTSQYAVERNSKNDEVHIVVVDDTGSVTGVPGNIVEKFVGLSKAIDGRIIPSQNNYYKEIVADFSSYVFPGLQETGTGSSLTLVSGSTTSYAVSSGIWGAKAQNTSFNVVEDLGNRFKMLINGLSNSFITISNVFGKIVSMITVVYYLIGSSTTLGKALVGDLPGTAFRTFTGRQL
jgi:hypothetical protein